MGRWDSSSEWGTRTEFREVDDVRDTTNVHGETRERYEMAQRNGLVERVALMQNVPRLPFRNSALAASVGKDVADFEKMPISRAAVSIAFDALVQSKNSMIPPKLCDERRASLVGGGQLDEGAYGLAISKARALVIFSWFFLGKGQILGFFMFLKVLADVTGTFERVTAQFPFADKAFWVFALIASVFAATGGPPPSDSFAEYMPITAPSTPPAPPAPAAPSAPAAPAPAVATMSEPAPPEASSES